MRFVTRLLLALLTLTVSAAAQAAPPVAVAAPPALITIVIFLAACACIFFCFQVFSVIRGGQLSKGWLMFTGGFVLLAVSQLMLLLVGFGVIHPGAYLVPVILAAMTVTFVLGLFEVKRVLG